MQSPEIKSANPASALSPKRSNDKDTHKSVSIKPNTETPSLPKDSVSLSKEALEAQKAASLKASNEAKKSTNKPKTSEVKGSITKKHEEEGPKPKPPEVKNGSTTKTHEEEGGPKPKPPEVKNGSTSKTDDDEDGSTGKTPQDKHESTSKTSENMPTDSTPITPKDADAKKIQVTVDIKTSESGYDNKIYWSTDNFATRNYLGVDNHTGTIDIGTFKAGTKIDFGIDNGQGQFFRTGSASANVDNIEHAVVKTTSEGTQIGFEDLVGGGDRDFNDAILNVRTTAVPEASNPSVNNRSGLNDGTNPGQGAGRENSPNQGTNNPNHAGALGYNSTATSNSMSLLG